MAKQSLRPFAWRSVDAKQRFDATHSGVNGSGTIWADFATPHAAQAFFDACQIEGDDVRFSHLHADRNRVIVYGKAINAN